ncbi:centriolar coiled-coil protein of 110 kDa-like [Brienomyrus brachyistius]|uniref:centriolar coiled-coil protein of 110 kDa-like n=1 Tax=Brienomyrus brachyistius TaxID=42636 RepID=UPI0020B318FC|nr:centriolar coiled-coil protein of 110 kDa-like [Brienomyrus brachyistius]
MESYKEFCSRSLARLQAEGKMQIRQASRGQQRELSAIRFHGRAVLCPVLSEEQRREMAQYRQKAAQLDAGRQARVQGEEGSVQEHLESGAQGQTAAPPSCTNNGFCQSPEKAGPMPSAPTQGEGPGDLGDQGGGVEESRSLDISLLTRFREQEQGCQGPWGVPRSLSDKENQRGGQSPPSPANTPHQTCPPEAASGGLLHDPSGAYTLPLSTGAGLSPRPHRRRPRPVSTGNILATSPINMPDRWGDSLAPSLDSSQRGNSFGYESPYSISPLGAGVAPSGFRRRCHTLDSNLNPSPRWTPIDRSQERLPRLMVPRSPPYDVGGSFPLRIHPHVAQDSSPRSEPESLLGGHSGVGVTESKNGDVQLKVQVLEEMRWQLEEERNWQLSVLIAEQERAQHRLLQELEEKERRLMEQGAELTSLGEPAASWGHQRDSFSPLSPSYPTNFPAEKSPVGSIGSLPSPNIHPAVYLWGSSKTRDRLIQMLSPEMQGALCRLSAMARGFLTRRLLKTEKVIHLRQTVQDTQDFIQSFRGETPLKKGALSTQDVALQQRVRAQLRAALYDVHDIFFEMPLEDRLGLLQMDRELRTERKIREMEKARSPKDRLTLSAATQKSLDRRKLRVRETPTHSKKAHQKPKSPPANRILQPSQGQNAPVAGQLLRQGSLYRKMPQERVRHSDMRKRHSLG